jgi:hypothetical protein
MCIDAHSRCEIINYVWTEGLYSFLKKGVDSTLVYMSETINLPSEIVWFIYFIGSFLFYFILKIENISNLITMQKGNYDRYTISLDWERF